MSNLFNNYFSKLESIYKDILGTKPTICYTGTLNKTLLPATAKQGEEVEWQAVMQNEKTDFEKLEKIFKFRINDELKEYYSTYCFFYITGNVEGTYIRLYSVGAEKSVETSIRQNHTDGKYDFKASQIFLIGTAMVCDDDNYFVYYNNETKEVFCYDSQTKNHVTIAKSLKDLFEKIEADI